MPPARDWEGIPAAHVEDTPDTPTIDTLVALANARLPRQDRPWTAADTLKNVVVTLVHPDGAREPLVVGVPGDREVDLKRLEAAVTPAEVEPFTEFDKHPELVKGYIGPAVLGEKSPSGLRYLLDPRVVPGTAWITGANEPGRHVFDLVAGRRLHGGRHHRGGRRPRRRPLPAVRRNARDRPRHRDRPHLPAGAQVRRGAGPAGARRERQARHGHDGQLRDRRQPGGRRRSSRPPTTSSACAGPARSRRPTCTSSPPARTTRCSTTAETVRRGAAGGRGPGAVRRPAEGVARRQVQGRRADRRPHHRRGRQEPRRRHGRDPRPAFGRPRGRARRRGRRARVTAIVRA